MIGAAVGCDRNDAPGNVEAASTDTWSRQTRVPGEYLVTLAPSAEAKVISGLYGRFGIKAVKNIAPNLYLVTLTEDPGPAAMEKLRAGDARIKAVVPNFVYRTQ